MSRRGTIALVAAATIAIGGCGGGAERTTTGATGPAVEAGGSSRSGSTSRVTVIRYGIPSRYVHRTLAQVALAPPGVRRAPLLVFLHGRGTRGPAGTANRDFLDALAALGRRAPAVVLPDGGDHSYFHDRRDGAWGSYVLREAIPAAVRRLRADPWRVAIGGISMGGFGAFDLALHHPGRFCAVGGHSPAIFTSASETAPGAFDDAADFARNDVVALAQARRPARRVWIDAGDGDPFLAGDRALAAALGVRVRLSRGGHDAAYWHAHYRDYLRFYASALARC